MFRILSCFALALSFPAVAAAPAQAASFDCAKATTPYERAICGNDALSRADERLAKTYATASGGLSAPALAGLRAGQRQWLDFITRACTDDAEPLAVSEIDEQTARCLLNFFNSRSEALEQSRMLHGLRFYPLGEYGVVPDPDEADNPGTSWPLGQHELVLLQLDSDAAFAETFNAFVLEEGDRMSALFEPMGGAERIQQEGSSNSSIGITLKDVVGNKRISLNATTYWYGHGAAHGNWTGEYLHFLIEKNRPMEAADLFTGKRWQKALFDLTVQALRAEHGEALFEDGLQYLTEAVADPARWDLSDPQGLVIQFQPYEVAAYAYGAPTATVRWEALEPYLAETARDVRYGE